MTACVKHRLTHGALLESISATRDDVLSTLSMTLEWRQLLWGRMGMKSLAAVVEIMGAPFRLVDIELADCQDHEVLVEIVATGVCHTDIAIKEGDFPIPELPAVLGHEGAGRVLSVGRHVTKVRAGDHVALSFSSCGECISCQDSAPARCSAFVVQNLGGTRPDGSFVHSRKGEPLHGSFFGQSSFAQHAVVPERNVVRVPKDIPLEIVGPLGCGIQTGAGTVLNHIKPQPGAHIAIFGAGAVGLSAIMAAKIAGCATIIAIDLQDSRLSLALEFGATHIVNPKAGEPVARIRAIVEAGVDHIVECSGAATALETAYQVIRTGATVSLVGMPRAGAMLSLSYSALMAGVTQTVCEGDSDPDIFIPRLIEYYREGRLPFDKLITFYPFADINRAITDAESGAVIKPVLLIGEGAGA
jgi:aryl-alcohol dehydrogenase